jgi:hypothetical protein
MIGGETASSWACFNISQFLLYRKIPQSMWVNIPKTLHMLMMRIVSALTYKKTVVKGVRPLKQFLREFEVPKSGLICDKHLHARVKIC